jgi:hypothetical protein
MLLGQNFDEHDALQIYPGLQGTAVTIFLLLRVVATAQHLMKSNVHET